MPYSCDTHIKDINPQYFYNDSPEGSWCHGICLRFIFNKDIKKSLFKKKKPPNLASGDFQPKPYHN